MIAWGLQDMFLRLLQHSNASRWSLGSCSSWGSGPVDHSREPRTESPSLYLPLRIRKSNNTANWIDHSPQAVLKIFLRSGPISEQWAVTQTLGTSVDPAWNFERVVRNKIIKVDPLLLYFCFTQKVGPQLWIRWHMDSSSNNGRSQVLRFLKLRTSLPFYLFSSVLPHLFPFFLSFSIFFHGTPPCHGSCMYCSIFPSQNLKAWSSPLLKG